MITDDLPVEVDDFLVSLRVERGRSRNTLNAYTTDLRAYVTWLDDRGLTISEVTEPIINDYVHQLRASGRAPASVKRALVSVRSVHRFLAEEREGTADPSAEVEMPRAPMGLPKALSEEEVELLLGSVTGSGPRDRRDLAILEVLYGTGIRISELSGMSLSDLDLDAGTVRVFGKGAKERIVPVGHHASKALRSWIEGEGGREAMEPERWARRDDADAVFLNRRGGRLQRQGAWLVVRTHGDRVGLGPRLTPHVLRHSYATHMLDHGADVRTVQELLGHASISTTQVYTKVSGERLQTVYRDAHPRAAAG